MRNARLSKAAVSLLALLFLLCASSAFAAPPDQLGKVNFPTTCSSDVQPAIEKGLALLHSFQYQESEQTFTETATREPKCAMAYWGKAMARYYQIWEFPNQKKLKEGAKDIERARKISSTSPREKGFIGAAAAFFQKKSKMSHAERKKAYSAALAELYGENPQDSEIGSFYALSLISLAYEDQDPLPGLKKAIAVLRPLLEKFPDHPGVAHYLIHAADWPELASQGLEAARRYAAIAPDSSHALHMPSHIFVRLGLWQDSINSNVAARNAGARAAEMHLAESHYQSHAMDFLSYSYLQSGQEGQAREVIEHTGHMVGANEQCKSEDRAYLAARTALELHRWKEAAELPLLGVSRKSLALDSTYWARAIGAARSGDRPAAESAVKELTALVAERQKRARQEGYSVFSEKPSDLGEAEAWLAFAKGNSGEALAELRDAADRQEKEGGESVGIPAREMLADMLEELKRPGEALAEYKAALKNSPNRFDGLLGAARAAQASGDTTAAQSFYAQLTSVCLPDADRPELAEAKTYLAQK